jgi:hypothetical protein
MVKPFLTFQKLHLTEARGLEILEEEPRAKCTNQIRIESNLNGF